MLKRNKALEECVCTGSVILITDKSKEVPNTDNSRQNTDKY